jgi:AcrR family transcriptional regulator
MTEEKVDKRVQRTRNLLKRALMQLVDEKGYDGVTIQDIVERANLGRTTFYLHYDNKDDLLLDHHFDFASALILRPLSYDELMASTPPPELEEFLQGLWDDKAIYLTITRAKDTELIMRGIRQQMINNLTNSLKAAFAGKTSVFPVDILANYIVGAYLSLIDWWLTNRTDHTAKTVAVMLHQLQRAAIKDAYGVDV